MKGAALKGHLDLLLLSVLRGEPRHGYAVIASLREISGDAFDLPEGTVYPALHRLERDGLIQSDWTEVAGRRRRVYQITGHGAETMDARRAEWAAFSSGVNAVLDSSPGARAPQLGPWRRSKRSLTPREAV